jgi:hypothetical protein
MVRMAVASPLRFDTDLGNVMNVKLARFRDAESERGHVPSGIEVRTNYELVERVNAAISLAMPISNGHNHHPVAISLSSDRDPAASD